MTVLDDLLAERDVLLVDGAMGTELFGRGLGSGDPPELWNVELPERVRGVHDDYIAAGSDIVLTNSFGGTSFRLKLHQLQDRVFELNKAAAAVARDAVDDSGRTVLVAGSMGPTGELLEPMGTMTPATCAAAFAEQAAGLTAGGADVLWIETMSHLDEVTSAVEGARSVSHLPICTTLSFDTAGRTMMGVTGTEAIIRLASVGVAAIGANCGNNLADTEAAIAEMRAGMPDGVGTIHLVSKANAGMPEWHGTELHYSGSPEVMAAHAVRQREAGARIIGACCGSSPRHLAMMRRVLDGELPVPEVEFEVAAVREVPKGRARRGRRTSRSAHDRDPRAQ